jgi:hypothetical protein
MSRVKYNYILQLKYNGKWHEIYCYESIDKARAVRSSFLKNKDIANYPQDTRIITQLVVDLEQE